MATFKVGQRVRFIGPVMSREINAEATRAVIGSEVVIVRRSTSTWEWVVKGDGLRNGIRRGCGLAPDEMQCDSCNLAPLTDPKADEFIERIKKLEREPQPVDVQERFVKRIEEVIGPLGPRFH